MIEPNTIHCGDCLELMPQIADKSIDMILCDLPYGVLNKQSEGGKWDSIIPFQPLWEQYCRIIKDNGAIILFAQGMFTAQLMMSNPKMWRYNLVWDKVLKTGFLNANRMPLRQHEDICVFYKKLPTYNPQMEKCKPRQKNHRRHKINRESSYTLTNRCYGKFNDVPDMITDEKFPTSIIKEPKQHIKGNHIIRQKSPSYCFNTSFALTPTRTMLYLTTQWGLAAQSLQQSKRNDNTLVSRKTNNTSR